MASLTIRDLDDVLKQNLRIRAAHRNRSMEEEARQILRAALLDPPAAGNLAQRIRARFAGLGDVSLPVIEREPVRTGPVFDAMEPAAGYKGTSARKSASKNPSKSTSKITSKSTSKRAPRKPA